VRLDHLLSREPKLGFKHSHLSVVQTIAASKIDLTGSVAQLVRAPS
jgi:hypothetical protein